MPEYFLTVHLHSDATFGRGEGLAGLVDVEIEHDERGCPFIGGRALKGLLVEEWANLRFALYGTTRDQQHLDEPAKLLFGVSGATHEGAARMRIGPAQLPADLRAALRREKMSPVEVLAALTAIRHQTSTKAETGAPEEGSLRAMRVLLRDTPLIARLDFICTPDKRALALLAACALAVRRGGTGRNRGRGRLGLLLHDRIPDDYDDAAFTKILFKDFAAEVHP